MLLDPTTLYTADELCSAALTSDALEFSHPEGSFSNLLRALNTVYQSSNVMRIEMRDHCSIDDFILFYFQCDQYGFLQNVVIYIFSILLNGTQLLICQMIPIYRWCM